LPVPRPLPGLDDIRTGGKVAVSRALSAVETADGSVDLARLLDAAAADPRALVIGLTGPPGVGKSTLTNALLRAYRSAGLSVGVVAVDPSSRFTGGARLGDRTRIKTDPEDALVFVRSMAARDRLGGLSEHAVAAIVLMRAVFDRVIVESVGIGQSEADIATVADSILLCIQPGSGDSLQFMKAGIMELPDMVVVTKADMGAPARRARADVAGALSLAQSQPDAWATPVILASSVTGEGIDAVLSALDQHQLWLDDASRRADLRRRQAQHWIEDAVRTRFGARGLARLDLTVQVDPSRPFETIRMASLMLDQRLGTLP
jgi:LAO/AO transport system kinase